MKIDMQSPFWAQVMGRQTGKSLILTGSMKTADAKKAQQQQDFLQKVSELGRSSGTKSAKRKETEAEKQAIFDQPDYSEFAISPKDVSKFMGEEMERYVQGARNTVDNLTGMEEQLKYMQAAYNQALEDGDTEKAGAIKEWTEKQYQDMSWMPGASMLGISHFRLDHASRLYGEAYGKEAAGWMGDLPGRVNEITEGLKGAESVDEALQQIAAAKEQLMNLADEVAGRYEAYTGNGLDAYEYKTAEDFKDVKWDSHLIYGSGNLKKADELLGTEYLKTLDISAYLQKGNVVDRQA